MSANKRFTGDCDTCKIVSKANCAKCEEQDYKWITKDGYSDIEWDKVPDKSGSLE